MGLLDRFILPEHRLAAVKIKDYATSIKYTSAEQNIAAALEVQLHQFVSERNVLRIGITRSALGLYASQSGKTEIALADHFNDLAVKEHFSTRPGMAVKDGLAVVEKARITYYIEEPVVVAEKFLTNLTGGRRESPSLHQFPQIQEYVQSLLREALLFVRTELSKV